MQGLCSLYATVCQSVWSVSLASIASHLFFSISLVSKSYDSILPLFQLTEQRTKSLSPAQIALDLNTSLTRSYFGHWDKYLTVTSALVILYGPLPLTLPQPYA